MTYTVYGREYVGITDTLPSGGDGALPPAEELWVLIQEARDYLRAWLSHPNMVHSNYGKIIFDTSTWGEKDGTSCKVCLAGLWYLQKGYGLLGEKGPKPPVPDFLDDLRYPGASADKLYDLLGVTVPEGLESELVSDHDWDRGNPNHILLFLDWLLEQHTHNALEANDNVR
jgi:hypothetical protein